MKTTTLTFTISSLILGTLFFAYQANVPQSPGRDTSSRAVATSLGASDQSVLLQRSERTKPSAVSHDESDAEESRLFNHGN